MKLRLRVLGLLACGWLFFAAGAHAHAQGRASEVDPVLLDDTSDAFHARQEQQRDRDRAEDLEVLSAILREDLSRLFARSPLAAWIDQNIEAQATDAAPAAFIFNQMRGEPQTGVGSPLADYLPGFGALVQIETPSPARPEPETPAAETPADKLSRWEAVRRRLRGETAGATAEGGSCATCHQVNGNHPNNDLWKHLLSQIGEREQGFHQDGTVAVAPTPVQIVAALVRVLGENGSQLRHLQADERIALSVHFTLPPRPRSRTLQEVEPATPPAGEGAADDAANSPPRSRELTGDLLLKQGNYAEAEKAFGDALRDQLKTHPESAPEELLRKALSAAVLRNLMLDANHQATDEEFVRRVHLDLTGLPPTPEDLALFLEDASPHKRVHLIAELLQQSDYASRWTDRWKDLRDARARNDLKAEIDPNAAAAEGDSAHSFFDFALLEQLHRTTSAESQAPQRGLISVTATKRQLDALAAGALQFAEFEKVVVVRVFDPSAPLPAAEPRAK